MTMEQKILKERVMHGLGMGWCFWIITSHRSRTIRVVNYGSKPMEEGQ